MKPNPIPVMAILLLLCLSSVAQQGDARYRLQLKNESFVPPKNINADRLSQFNRTALRSADKIFAVLQFEQIPSEADRQLLLANGIELLDYIPDNAYTVVLSGSVQPEILQSVKARSLIDLSPKQKMQPQLAAGIFPAHAVKTPGTLDVWISFPKSFDAGTVIGELKNKNFDINNTVYTEYRIIGLRIAAYRLNELASMAVVEYLQAAPQQDQLLNNVTRVNSRANMLNAPLSVGGRNLRGEGVVIGIGDNADPQPHIDFNGRLINRAAAPFNFHGTHVHGIVGAAGTLTEQYHGYAPKATLLSQTFSNVFTNAAAYTADHNMVITNNSYGVFVNDCSQNGLYDLYSRLLDQQAFALPQLINLFAAGNSATGSGYAPCPPYPTDFKTVLGSYQSAKNVLTVGNTYPNGDLFPQSSRGPVQDGRIKPEITVQGTFVVSTATFAPLYFRNTGTSMATPGASGGLALLYQRYRQLNGGANPKNGLMKALLCNGATDKGNAGPDYSYGFGWMNLLRSVKMLEQNNYTIDSLANGATKTHAITVPANTALLKVMLYWNDPAAAPLAYTTLVNDLDLEVRNPAGNTVLPAKLDTLPANVNNTATTGADHINNIEQVVITNPAAGNYTVTVKATAITQNPRQEYFLVYDTIPVSTVLTFPVGGERLKSGDSAFINWDAYGDPANTFTVEYSTDNGSNWITIDANAAANLRQLKWVFPTIATEQARVRITRNGTTMISTSQPFTIIGQPVISLSAVQCEGTISIDWTAVPGATDYEIMKLTGDEMTPVATTTATTFFINGLSKDSVYWLSVRARINGNPGLRGTAVSRQPNNGSCAGTISDNDLKLDAIVSPASSGRRFTSTELSNAVPVTIRIKNLDDVATTGNVTVSYSVNGAVPVTQTIINPAIAAGGTLTYTFLASTVDMSAAGNYQLQATVSQAGDVVTLNNSLSKTFSQLNNAAITVPFTDNIESGTVQTVMTSQMGLQGLDRYDFATASVNGRIRTFVNSGIAYSGSKALTLDADRFINAGVTDSLTATFNMAAFNAAIDDIRLDFRYKNHGQQPNAANRVWVRGNDQQPWIQVYDLTANQNDVDGTYKLSAGIELSDILSANAQNFSSSFQVRWGQWGRFIAADNNGGAGYSFDDIRLYAAINDLQMMSIDTPIVSSCALTATTPVRITLRNSANTAVSNVPVKFRVDGGTVTTEIIASIAANTTITYNFIAAANLAAPGNHKVEVWADLASDNYRSNDSATVNLVNGAVVTSYPYLENFETGAGGWYSEGKNSSWELAAPTSRKIFRAASGAKAWKTRAQGNYSDFEKSYLYSPCFNVSGMTVPTLSLSIALDLEDCGNVFCDGAYVEYSGDGKTWTRLGASGQGTNWYNKAYTGNNLWSTQTFFRWHVATIPLPTGLSSLRLRFVMSADAAANREGIAIDDIHIYDNSLPIYDGPTLTTPVTQSINGGNNWMNFISGGKIIASIKPNNQNMGNTDLMAYINTAAIRNYNGQYYHNRSASIKPVNRNLADSVSVRIYFLETESDTLIKATGCATCTKPGSAYELGISKYSDSLSQFENGLLTDDTLGNWTFIPSALVTKVPYLNGYYAEFKTTSFSEFWLSNGGPGAVHPLRDELLAFTVRKITGNTVQTDWTMKAENNIVRYEIEVARGNTDYQAGRFSKLGETIGAGNTNTTRSYSYMDTEADKSGVRYYRLKIIYADGGYTYSAVRSVVFYDGITLQVYPNPSNGLFNLVYQLPAGQTLSLQVYDAAGKQLRQQTLIASGFLDKQLIDFNAAMYPAGLYVFRLGTEDQQQVFKVIKQ